MISYDNFPLQIAIQKKNALHLLAMTILKNRFSNCYLKWKWRSQVPQPTCFWKVRRGPCLVSKVKRLRRELHKVCSSALRPKWREVYIFIIIIVIIIITLVLIVIATNIIFIIIIIIIIIIMVIPRENELVGVCKVSVCSGVQLRKWRRRKICDIRLWCRFFILFPCNFNFWCRFFILFPAISKPQFLYYGSPASEVQLRNYSWSSLQAGCK